MLRRHYTQDATEDAKGIWRGIERTTAGDIFLDDGMAMV